MDLALIHRSTVFLNCPEMGGKGHTGLVLDRVGELMKGITNDFDREQLPKQRNFRWRNMDMEERLDMVKAGLL